MNKLRQYNKNRLELHEEMYDLHGFYFCQNCGRSGVGLECHHLIFRSEKPNHEHINHKKNLIIVCRKCHDKFHGNKGARNKIVESRGLDLLFGNDVLNK